MNSQKIEFITFQVSGCNLWFAIQYKYIYVKSNHDEFLKSRIHHQNVTLAGLHFHSKYSSIYQRDFAFRRSVPEYRDLAKADLLMRQTQRLQNSAITIYIQVGVSI